MAGPGWNLGCTFDPSHILLLWYLHLWFCVTSIHTQGSLHEKLMAEPQRVAKFSWVEVCPRERKTGQGGEMRVTQLSRGALISTPSHPFPTATPAFPPSLTAPELSPGLSLASLDFTSRV